MINYIEEIEKIDKNFFNNLKDCNHGFDGKVNPYHLEAEGNIFGHTVMVYKESLTRFPEDNILHLACLLHDIAKPNCREENSDKERCSFFNHENMGVFLVIDILEKLKIKPIDKIRVLELIQRHADSYKLSEKNLKKLYTLEDFKDILKIRECDMYGRIAQEGNEKDKDALEQSKSYDIVECFPELKEFKSTCTLLIGPPCSGKSTFLTNSSASIISRDNCLMQLSTNKNYNQAWHTADQKEVDTLFESSFKNQIQRNEDFYIDMTNMNVKSRRRFIERLKNKYNIDCIVFLVQYETLLNRNSKRTNKILDIKVIDSMCKRFQMPYPGEGFRTITYKGLY